MMQATDFGNLHDPSPPRRARRTWRPAHPCRTRDECASGDSTRSSGPGCGADAFRRERERDSDKRILPGAVRRREDFVDPHAPHAVPNLLAVDLVTVAQEIGRRGVVRKASAICWALQSAVGCSVTLKWMTRRRWWTRTKRTRSPAVGTVKKSIETKFLTWLIRSVRQLWEGGVRHFGSSRETVRSATSMPSFRSSPRILGAPQRGSAAARRATRALISAVTGGRSPTGRPESRVQHAQKRHRCPSGRCPESRSRRVVSTRSRPWPARPRKTICRSKPGPGRRPLVHGELLGQGEVLDRKLTVAAAEERE
jgi:hypothetical protein